MNPTDSNKIVNCIVIIFTRKQSGGLPHKELNNAVNMQQNILNHTSLMGLFGDNTLKKFSTIKYIYLIGRFSV